MENTSAQKLIAEALSRVVLEKAYKTNTVSKIAEALKTNGSLINTKEQKNKESEDTIQLESNLYEKKHSVIESENKVTKNQAKEALMINNGENYNCLINVLGMEKDMVESISNIDSDMEKIVLDFAKTKEKIDCFVKEAEQAKNKALLRYNIEQAAIIDKKLRALKLEQLKLSKDISKVRGEKL